MGFEVVEVSFNVVDVLLVPLEVSVFKVLNDRDVGFEVEVGSEEVNIPVDFFELVFEVLDIPPVDSLGFVLEVPVTVPVVPVDLEELTFVLVPVDLEEVLSFAMVLFFVAVSVTEPRCSSS